VLSQVVIYLQKCDKTLPTITYPKHPKNGGKTRNKMEGHTSKKTNEPSKRADHKRNIKIPNPFLLQETYQIRKRGEPLE
jgi:hypothetical protein